MNGVSLLPSPLGGEGPGVRGNSRTWPVSKPGLGFDQPGFLLDQNEAGLSRAKARLRTFEPMTSPSSGLRPPSPSRGEGEEDEPVTLPFPQENASPKKSDQRAVVRGFGKARQQKFLAFLMQGAVLRWRAAS